MKRINPGKNIVIALVAAVVVGVLLSRKYPQTGVIVSLVAIGVYVVMGARLAIGRTANFKRIDIYSKLLLATWLVQLYVFSRGVLTFGIPYFLLLLTMGLEYFIHEKRENQ